MKEWKLYIGGQWLAAGTGDTFDDRNPYNGEVWARVQKAGIPDAQLAMKAAFDARKPWQKLSAAQRAAIIHKAGEILEAEREEYMEVLREEGGSTCLKAAWEVSQTVDMLYTAAGMCRTITGSNYLNDPAKVSLTRRSPRGTIVAIAPWNFPLVLAMEKVAFGLAAGNTIVLKPSSDTPVIGLKIGELFQKAGIPDGALNVITGPGGALGESLICSKYCSMVAITGDSITGRKIAVMAAQNMKEYTLELGGKNPLIVLKDADVDYAAKIAAWGAYLHQGEICMSVDRVIIEEPIFEAVTARLAEIAASLHSGDPADPQTFVGPLVNAHQRDSVDELVQDAVEKGAEILTGGVYEGNVYRPTVLKGVTPAMRIYYEEIFGPVTCVLSAKDREEALSIANDTAAGLSAGIVTDNVEDAIYLAESIESGMVHINDSSVDGDAVCPFGGVKESGRGRELGMESIYEMMELKWITVLREKRGFPF